MVRHAIFGTLVLLLAGGFIGASDPAQAWCDGTGTCPIEAPPPLNRKVYCFFQSPPDDKFPLVFIVECAAGLSINPGAVGLPLMTTHAANTSAPATGTTAAATATASIQPPSQAGTDPVQISANGRIEVSVYRRPGTPLDRVGYAVVFQKTVSGVAWQGANEINGTIPAGVEGPATHSFDFTVDPSVQTGETVIPFVYWDDASPIRQGYIGFEIVDTDTTWLWIVGAVVVFCFLGLVLWLVRRKGAP